MYESHWAIHDEFSKNQQIPESLAKVVFSLAIRSCCCHGDADMFSIRIRRHSNYCENILTK